MLSRLEKFFTTWQEAVNFAHKNKLWGKVVVVKRGDVYAIEEKEKKN